MLSLSEQKDCLKRQLKLVKENQELTKEIEFRDYRIQRLEKELEEMKGMMVKLHYNSTEANPSNNLKMTYERINIYG